ncbi:hypothetical protein Syun_006697 [Stephania yunnanensis]|uniref:Uncharacterized protein n=1 Tax=Stephania yunnanensis TaxID=152371 RepID=A0AAP0KX84_9MAGN
MSIQASTAIYLPRLGFQSHEMLKNSSNLGRISHTGLLIQSGWLLEITNLPLTLLPIFNDPLVHRYHAPADLATKHPLAASARSSSFKDRFVAGEGEEEVRRRNACSRTRPSELLLARDGRKEEGDEPMNEQGEEA